MADHDAAEKQKFVYAYCVQTKKKDFSFLILKN